MGIPESSYYYHIKQMQTNNSNQALEEQIQAIFDENDGNYGYRRIQLALRNKGMKVNHKKIQRIMKERGLNGKKFTRKSRRYNSYKGTVGTVSKNRINRRFHTGVADNGYY